MPYGQSAPAINPHTFPYLKRFDQDELDDLFERIDAFRAALTDPVGPSGVKYFIDDGTIANIAFHLAMVGARIVDDEHAYIWADIRDDPEQIFQGYVTWRLKKDHEPPPPKPAEPADPVEVARQAAAARELIDRQLAPAVRKLLIANLAKEFTHDTTDPEDDQ